MNAHFVQRLYNPSEEAVGFLSDGLMLDYPGPTGIVTHAHDVDAVLFSHWHKDHCPHEKIPMPARGYMNVFTQRLLGYRGESPKTYMDLATLPRSTGKIRIGNTWVTIVPMSHSDDSVMFIIEKDNGSTIVYPGDIGEGFRTDTAIEFVRKMFGKSGCTLLLGDATRLFKKSLTRDQQLVRLNDAFRYADANKLPCIINIKPGNFGLIPFWFSKGIFDNRRDVVFTPGIIRMCARNQLNIVSKMADERVLMHSVEDTLKTGDTLIVDSFYDIGKFGPSIVINATRKALDVSPELCPVVFEAGMPGHSGEMFLAMAKAANPRFIAFSHPPKGKGMFDMTNVVLTKKGETIDI